jgi:hypothetical protein
MYASRLRVAAAARHLSKRTFSATPRQLEAASSTTSTASPTTTTAAQVPSGGPAPTAVAEQAPNRAEIWSRSQRPRAVAMTGPRFEQTDFELQVGFCTLRATPGMKEDRIGLVGFLEDDMLTDSDPSPGRTPPSS